MTRILFIEINILKLSTYYFKKVIDEYSKKDFLKFKLTRRFRNKIKIFRKYFKCFIKI